MGRSGEVLIVAFQRNAKLPLPRNEFVLHSDKFATVTNFPLFGKERANPPQLWHRVSAHTTGS